MALPSAYRLRQVAYFCRTGFYRETVSTTVPSAKRPGQLAYFSGTDSYKRHVAQTPEEIANSLYF